MGRKMGTKRHTVKPVLAVTSIKQPTCLEQPNKMFPNVNFVLIFTSVKQPPALSSFCASLAWLLNTGLTVYFMNSYMYLLEQRKVVSDYSQLYIFKLYKNQLIYLSYSCFKFLFERKMYLLILFKHD